VRRRTGSRLALQAEEIAGAELLQIKAISAGLFQHYLHTIADLSREVRMFRSFSAALLAVLLGIFALAVPAAGETLRLGGTGGAIGMAQRIADAYAAPGTRIEVVPGLGSSGAINAVADGVIAIAISSRPLKSAEEERGLKAVYFARTPIVWITSHPAPPGIRAADLPDIFAQTRPQWADGTPLNVVLRVASDTDVSIVEGYFPGLADAFALARQRPEIPVTATDQDNTAVAEELQGSFVHAGLSQIVTEQPDLRIVSLDGVEPSAENLESGAYPYEKPFYMVYAADSADAAARLLEFLRSEPGRALLRDAGSLPVVE
jgi:phosphate transport system substrate-binding protein